MKALKIIQSNEFGFPTEIVAAFDGKVEYQQALAELMLKIYSVA